MQNSGFNWKFIFKVLGFIIVIESLFLFLSAGISAYYKEWDTPYLLISAGIALIPGILFILFGSKEKINFVGKREGFVAVSLTWLLFCIFGMVPYYISGAIPSLTDAFFETMSGLTTTGSSILTDVESMPKGLLFWRSLTQWLGGMGVIVFSLALLPLIGGGATQLFEAETTGVTQDKFRPRVAQISKRLWMIYAGLTIAVIILLNIGPMDTFDSICHGLTTISTGGYSTKSNSIAYWNSAYIENVIIIFMLIGSINFSLLYFCFKGKFKKVIKNEELQWFFLIVIIATIIISFFIIKNNVFDKNISTSIRDVLFQVVSTISTTGFMTNDFITWEPFYWVIFLILMVICGCAGSTSGGMKTIRIVILAKNTINEFYKQIHPKAVFPVRVSGIALPLEIVQRVVSFVFLFILIIILSWLILALSGMGFDEALGAAITAISNVGPGLGANGPSGNFAEIPVFAKWYMSFLMLVGRLEIFTILILFTPAFWKE